MNEFGIERKTGPDHYDFYSRLNAIYEAQLANLRAELAEKHNIQLAETEGYIQLLYKKSPLELPSMGSDEAAASALCKMNVNFTSANSDDPIVYVECDLFEDGRPFVADE